MERNPGCELDLGWLNSVHVNLSAINTLVAKYEYGRGREINSVLQAKWLMKAITLIDLTTLAGDDTHSNVSLLCFQAIRPIREALLHKLGYNYDDSPSITTAAVCVYPARVDDAVQILKRLGYYGNKVQVASVATGFPSGQTPLATRLAEIKFAVAQGATEIDIVINRSLVLTGQWEELYREIQQMKEACGEAHMKAILATGELGTLNNVYKASLVAMMAGSDFIKTSTGKEEVNATLQFGIVMSRAIKDYHEKMGYKVGLKAAGGIKTSRNALSWMILVKELLGDDWLNSKLFRFGASGLLGELEAHLAKLYL